MSDLGIWLSVALGIFVWIFITWLGHRLQPKQPKPEVRLAVFLTEGGCLNVQTVLVGLPEDTRVVSETSNHEALLPVAQGSQSASRGIRIHPFNESDVRIANNHFEKSEDQ
jgi:hypothetical protein